MCDAEHCLSELFPSASQVIIAPTKIAPPKISVAQIKPTLKVEESATAKKSGRLISRLHPDAAVLITANSTVAQLATLMASKRSDVAVIMGASRSGPPDGIVTDHDITRKIIAEGLDPHLTQVYEIMTPNPQCVQADADAISVMATMAERSFRHMPVIDGDKNIVGVINISRCLYDAISRLEKQQAAAPSSEAAVGAMMRMTGGGAPQAEIMKNMFDKMFGGITATVDSLLEKSRANCSIPTGASARDAAALIATTRRAVLVIDDIRGTVCGILTPKDLVTRVLAKELSPETTLVRDVMTPNPEVCQSDTTLVEALHILHAGRFLHLPVVSVEGGMVRGVIEVKELAFATMGGDGREGWKTFLLDHEVADTEDDTLSDAGSRTGSSHALDSEETQYPKRSVAQMRPEKPLVVDIGQTVFQVAQAMASKRTDVALVVRASSSLVGIATDHDIVRKAVARSCDPTTTPISDCMTADPQCVTADSSGLDALETMVSSRFRHMPVTDGGNIAGVLNISKCLYDAVTRLEKRAPTESAAVGAMMQQMTGGAQGVQQAAMRELLQPVLERMFGTKSTLGSLLDDATGATGDRARCCVDAGATTLEAAQRMAQTRRAVLVTDDDAVVGILTPKDVITRVIAKGLDPPLTTVRDVMTPNPEMAEPEMTLADALSKMHAGRFLHLPVVTEGCVVWGVIEVKELALATMEGDGQDGWKKLLTADDDTRSERSIPGTNESTSTPAVAPLPARAEPPPERAESVASEDGGDVFLFKVLFVVSGELHRITASSESFSKFRHGVMKALGKSAVDKLVIKYEDEDGDNVIIADSPGLARAVKFTRDRGLKALKVSVAPAAAPTKGAVALRSLNRIATRPRSNMGGALVVAAASAALALFAGRRR